MARKVDPVTAKGPKDRRKGHNVGVLPSVDGVLRRLWSTARMTKMPALQRKATNDLCISILKQLGGQFSNNSNVNVNHQFENLSDAELEKKKQELIKSMLKKPEKK